MTHGGPARHILSRKMAQHNETGRRGEELACRYLARQDYRLLDRNWRCGHLEIDIIADDFGEVVFVEVKTRRDETLANAADAVTLEKKKHLLDAARAYLAQKQLDQPFRFDIITVVGERPPFRLTHIRNAFSTESVHYQISPHRYGH